MNSKEAIAKIHALSINAGAKCTKAGMSGPSTVARRGYGAWNTSGLSPATIGNGVTNGLNPNVHVQDIHDLAHELSYSSKSTKSGLSAKFATSEYQEVHDSALALGAQCYPQPGIALSQRQAGAQSVHDSACQMGAVCGQSASFSAPDDEPDDEPLETVMRWIRR